MAEGDVRGFYARLGVEIPEWASVEAAVSCFADPGAHKNQDRSKSCSVNLASGAWHCWGCGAKGGAYDAALARGLDSRHAFALKVAYYMAWPSATRTARSHLPAPVVWRRGRRVWMLSGQLASRGTLWRSARAKWMVGGRISSGCAGRCG
jgi:hypothetical protein